MLKTFKESKLIPFSPSFWVVRKFGNAGVIVNEQITTLAFAIEAGIDIPMLARWTNRKNKRDKKKEKRLNTAIVEFRACNFLKRAPSIPSPHDCVEFV